MVVGRLSLSEVLADEVLETGLCLPKVRVVAGQEKESKHKVKELNKYAKVKRRVIPKPIYNSWIDEDAKVLIKFDDKINSETKKKAVCFLNQSRAFRRGLGLQ